jgi:hypothetical protein
MVSSSFINNKMSSFLDLNITETANSDIDTRISMYTEAVNEYEFMLDLGGNGSLTEDYLVTEGGGILEAIGKFVIGLVKRIKLLIEKFFDTFKSQKVLDKEAIDIVNDINKKNPGVGKKLYQAYNTGRAKLCDLRRMKELDTGFDEVLAYANSKSADPRTLKEKFESFKGRVADMSTGDVMGAIAVAGTVAGSFVDIGKVGKAIKDSMSNMRLFGKKVETAGDKIIESYDKLQVKNGQGKNYLDPHSLTKEQIMKNLFHFYNHEYERMVKAEAGAITNLRKELNDLVAKHANATSAKEKDNLQKKIDSKQKKIDDATQTSLDTLKRLNEDRRLYRDRTGKTDGTN